MARRLLHYRFAAEPANLKPMRERVRTALRHNGLSEQDAEALVLGLNEACMNIIEHAYGPQAPGDIILNITDEDEWLQFELFDFAPAVDVTCIQPRDLSEIRPGGLGTHFIKEIMDEVSYHCAQGQSGNLLQMRKRKPQV